MITLSSNEITTVRWQDGDWEASCSAHGGRLTRVRWCGVDLLTQPHLPNGTFRAPSDEWGDYEKQPVFGYDDCWPSLDPSMWPGMECDICDHGELWWREWSIFVKEDALIGLVSDRDRGWTFRRRISCEDDALRFDFSCSNTGGRNLYMNWAGHVLIPPSSVMSLHLPEFGRIRQVYPQGQSLPGWPTRTPGQVWKYLQSLPQGESVGLILDDLSSDALHVQVGELEWQWGILHIDRPALALWYNRRGYPKPNSLGRDEFGIEWMTSSECRLDKAVRSGSAISIPPGDMLNWSISWKIAEPATSVGRTAEVYAHQRRSTT